jgi:glycosyltransferase involved in cell wall biosynthesis
MKVIITSPSLNPEENVSGISSVTQFIISNNKEVEYIHFEVGKRDAESGGTLNRLRRIWRNRLEWKRLLHLHPDAVIHYNMPLMGAAVIRDYMLLQVAHKLGNPIVLHVHGGNYMKNRQRPWIIQRLIETVFSWAKHIIVLSEEEKQIVEEDFNVDNVHSLPNCIDLTEARDYKRKFEAENPLSILYLGRIEKNKGIDYILEVAKKLKADKVPFTLHFAGKEETQDEYIPQFKSELGESFIYHGVVFGKVKNDLLKQCDVFLLPSFYEGLPMSLIETMSFGMVPVVTNVGSISSIVNDKQNGLFVKVKDTDSIMSVIKTLCTDISLVEDLSVKAQQTLLSLFRDKDYVDKLNILYGNK